MRVPPSIRYGILAIIILFGSPLRAGAPLGVPIGIVEEGQWTLGLEYGFEEADLEAYGLSVRTVGGSPAYTAESIDIEGLKTNMIFGTLAYGVCDNWDLFVRVGIGDGQDDIAVGTTPGGNTEGFRYDGGYGLAWGLGTRATFCHWGPWRFGGTAQVTWFDPKDSDFSSANPASPNTVFAGRANIDFWQTQVALAAVYQIDTLTFWAGPFLQFVEGDLDRSGRILVDGADVGSFRGSSDIEESSQLGIHTGVSWEISTRFNCHLEGQFTNDSWFVGLGAVVRPGEFFAGP